VCSPHFTLGYHDSNSISTALHSWREALFRTMCIPSYEYVLPENAEHHYLPLSIDVGMRERAACDRGDEVDRNMAQTSTVKKCLEALQKIIDNALQRAS